MKNVATETDSLFSALFSPICVGNLTLKNRIIMPAMHHVYTPDGMITERFLKYYQRRAEGGAALITIGACRFDGYGARSSTLKLDCDEDIPSHSDLVSRLHAYECLAALQLYHAGRYMKKSETPCGDEALAPSSVYASFTRETARAMMQDDIVRTRDAWVKGALRAKEAGYDAVEISASAGYLISQFLSPLTNLRTDQYGGNFENRCRFPLEVLREVRTAVGPDYPILLRCGGNDLVPGSCTSRDCKAFIQQASEYVDLVSLTGGWHESKIPQLTGETPRGALIHLSGLIKDAVQIPVAMANHLGNPEEAAKDIILGYCDIVAMGRPLIADPDLPLKLSQNRRSEIRPCVVCNQGCLAGTFFDKPVRCLVNGLAGKESCLSVSPTVSPKKILVIGAGPAGCSFAITAAKRGHSVTLAEKSDQIGGQVRSFSEFVYRREFSELLRYYSEEIKRNEIKLLLNTQISAQTLIPDSFDNIVFACGRQYKPIELSISDDAPPVFRIDEYLKNKPILGRRVAIIGGSFTGMEIARELLLDGSINPERLYYLMRHSIESDPDLHSMIFTSRREVAIFERGRLGAGYESGTSWPTYGDLTAFGAELFSKTEVTGITRSGVEYASGKWPCDAVIVCSGTVPDNSLYHRLSEQFSCIAIGNFNRVGRVIDAVEAGTEQACTI